MKLDLFKPSLPLTALVSAEDLKLVDEVVSQEIADQGVLLYRLSAYWAVRGLQSILDPLLYALPAEYVPITIKVSYSYPQLTRTGSENTSWQIVHTRCFEISVGLANFRLITGFIFVVFIKSHQSQRGFGVLGFSGFGGWAP